MVNGSRRVAWAALVLAGCAGTSRASTTIGARPSVAASVPASPATAPSPSASAATTIASAPTSTITRRPRARDLDLEFEKAPCDFARLYRGTIGEAHVSLLLRRASDGSLTAEAHEDGAGKSLTLHGALVGLTFSLSATTGATYRGECNEADGSLRGAVALAGKEAPLALTPRPASWPGLYGVTRFVRVDPVDAPACKSQSLPDATNVVTAATGEEITCLPRNAAARRALLDEEPAYGCFVRASSYRVFGVGDAKLEAKINKALAGRFFETHGSAVRCGAPQFATESVGIVDADAHSLVFEREKSFGSGAIYHPVTSADAAETIDLTTGDPVLVRDLVSDLNALPRVAARCASLYRAALASAGPATTRPKDAAGSEAPVACGEEPRILWGCGERQEPNLIVTPRGIVLGTEPSANPYGSQPYGGAGPLLTWEVLKREGLLASKGKAARVWQATTAAGAEEPVCEEALDHEGVIEWRPVSP